MSLHNRLNYAAEGRNRCQTRIWAQIICAEDIFEAVRIGVDSRGEVMARTQVIGDQGGSGVVQRRMFRDHKVVEVIRKS